jgi:hypothetical protein
MVTRNPLIGLILLKTYPSLLVQLHNGEASKHFFLPEDSPEAEEITPL